MAKTTLPPMWWPLMEAGDRTPGHCIVCCRTNPTEKHHPVKRSAGEMIDPATGEKRRKPVFELCGFGNNEKDPDGRWYCHGKAHAGLLFFRYESGCVEFFDITPEWRDEWERTEGRLFGYIDALKTEGWRPICE